MRRLGEKSMNRRAFLKASSTTAGVVAVSSQLSERAVGQSVDESPTFRRPKTIVPVPVPSPQSQHVEAGVPDTQLTREATGLLREFSTPLLFNHSHRAFFWANEMGRQTGQKFDVELVFICAAFHDLGLLKKFSSADDRFEVDSANAVRQFLEHHNVPNARIQTAWDAISLHTTPGIAAYKPLEVELLYNGVALDVLGVGYETFPAEVRTKVVNQFPRIDFKHGIAQAFLGASDTSPKRPSLRATKTSARTSSATISGAISTIRFRIHHSKTPRRVVETGSPPAAG
jgi:hypothetical protein